MNLDVLPETSQGWVAGGHFSNGLIHKNIPLNSRKRNPFPRKSSLLYYVTETRKEAGIFCSVYFPYSTDLVCAYSHVFCDCSEV